MAAEIIPIDSQDFSLQTYENQQTSLMTSVDINTFFSSSSYIESFIYDLNKNLLSSNYNFTDYKVLNNGQSSLTNELNQIELDIESYVVNNGYSQGEYITTLNFLNKQIGSNLQQLYISEISSDRTEVRLDSTDLTDFDIEDQTNDFVIFRRDSNYFVDFYLNFGDNQLILSNNIQLDNQDPLNPTILVKLYEPLPEEYTINSTLWVVTTLEEPKSYQVIFEPELIEVIDSQPIKGPNFNLDIKDQINNSTVSLDYSTLTSTSLTSSFNQLSSLLEEKEIDINIDYTNFSNFVHFSSVQTRLENFYYKMALLEDYSSSIASLNNTTNNNPSSSLVVYETQINNIITNFDGYEYYLYYNSGSYAWPKTTSQPPYQQATINSIEVLNWFGSTEENSPYYGGIILSASLFDNTNKDNLLYSIPEYLRDDPQNNQYQLFIDMIGQFYDNIWVYYKDVTQKYNADNRLESGISKDIVADAIRDFGIKLYQNNFSNDDLYTAFIGLTPQGGLFPFPNITGSLPTPSGFEYVNTLISASNDYMPLDDVNKSLYKRIYHNLPYLLKAKGTLPGLRTLITSYGIPDTILRINEYGGKDKVNSNDWDYWQNTFNYAYDTLGTNYISSSWNDGDINPLWGSVKTVQFRFQTRGIPTDTGYYSQSLWSTGDDSAALLRLRYTGSGYTSGSYSGSIPDPYNEYVHLDLIPDISIPTVSASVYLPFFNGDWWNVMITVNDTFSEHTLYAGNKPTTGENSTTYQFLSSASVSGNDVPWTDTEKSYFPATSNSALGKMFSGSYQEIRYFTTKLDSNIFKDYIMNPYSIEGLGGINSSPNELIFRASLGGELYTGSKSIHPKVTGSWAPTSSFSTNSNFYISNTSSFVTNKEYFFFDQPVVGIKNAISDKIRVENSIIPTGSVLSPFRSLAQNLAISQSYTANTNLLEVAFSPQDEINDDITSQIGYFEIGELIGDPRLRSSSATSYPDLDALRNEYFEKYTSNYDLNDYIRLIKFFDNSLFKMIKDFVPARTSLASGVVIKQTLLERNKYPQPQTTIDSTIAYYGSGSQNNLPFVFQNVEVSGTVAPQWNDYNPGTIENFSGGTGGTMDMFNGVNTSPYGPNGTGPQNIFGITQSWYETAITPSGSVLILHDSQDEFYDGEFSGSVILVTTQSLAQPYNVENISVNYKHVYYYGISKPQNDTFEDNFLAPQTSPSPGEILFFNYKEKGFFSNPTLNAYNTTFIKIAKEDCNGNDNSLPLGQITKLYVYNPNQAVVYPSNYSLQFDEYNVVVANEYPDYYLYETLRNWNILSAIGPIADPHDNQVFDYTVSSSVTASYNVGNGSPKTIINWNSTLAGTNLSHYNTPYFNTSSGILTFENTPNVPLLLSASLTSSGTGFSLGTSWPISLIQNRNNTETVLATQFYSTLGTTNILLTASLYPIQNDQYYIKLEKPASGGSISITKADLYLYQRWNNYILDTFYGPSTSSCAPTILEPYITEPNYYNSDYNPLINNVLVDRLSTIYQDVDYSTGIYTPTNFDLLISGSALKAAVQDSNYTSKRVINPRYNGVKSTSQVLNQWTPGDTGTYGKLPTVENLKTVIAYCDWIGGWPPERENASGIHVLYLIKSDGTVIIPNTSENSLADIKGNFETGENILISTKTVSAGQPQQFRKVIRGGTRIEPILYTQYGQAPNINWNTTMSFTDTLPPPTSASADYSAQFIANPIALIYANGSNNTVTYSSANYGSSYLNGFNSYEIPLGAVQDAVALTFKGLLKVTLYADFGFNINFNVKLSIWKNNTTQLWYQLYNNQSSGDYTYNISYTQNTNLTAGDTYTLKISATEDSNLLNGFITINNGSFTISQYPIFSTPSPITTGVNSIWQYYNTTNYPNVITSSVPELVQFYGDPEVKMVDLTGSGFNPIQLPWSIEYGDEFRFEGREDFVYQVGKVFAPGDSGSGRLTQTGSIEVHFNSALPVSASSSAFNLDHFLIRRYVDDASQIIMEGFKPVDASGPYIVRPEYVVPELNKSVDQFILDLTQKGLIT